jgi:hypothetical protein
MHGSASASSNRRSSSRAGPHVRVGRAETKIVRIVSLTIAALVISLPALAQSAQPPLAAIAPPAGPVLGPKTLTAAHVACTDSSVTTAPASPLHVVAPHSGDSHELSYRNDVVVLSGGTPEGLMAGQRFFTRRYRAPRNGEPVSDRDRGAVRTSGWITVIAADEYSALARVDYACDGVAAGDYLDAYAEPTLPAQVAAEGPTNFSALWRVLPGVDARESFGAGDVLSIDRGSAHGLSGGIRVAFYRDRENGAPLVELGTGIVVEVTMDSAKVVVDRARSAIVTGDYVALRQP